MKFQLVCKRSAPNKKLTRLHLEFCVPSLQFLPRLIIALLLIFSPVSVLAQTIDGVPSVRIKPSTPEQLLIKIYNSAIAGSDRLSDIENYMSRSLRSKYRAATKSVSKGRGCTLPRVIVNGLFSGKIRGFIVTPVSQNWREAEAYVRINTGVNRLSESDPLQKFDPEVYEKISFKFSKFLLDWKIDNIVVNEPSVDETKGDAISYKKIDLREALRACS